MKLIIVLLMLLVVAGVFYFMVRPARHRGRAWCGDGSGADSGSAMHSGSPHCAPGPDSTGSGDCSGGDGGGD